MNNRSKHLTFYTFLIGLLILSFSFNILFYSRLLILQDFVRGYNPWVSTEEINILQKEIERLETTKYQIIPNN